MNIDLDKVQHREQLLDNSNTLYYVVVDGVCYQYAIKLKDGTYKERDKTDMARLIEACEYARNHNERIRLWYGDAETGRSWGDEYNVLGYIGKTFGKYNIPILVSNKRSSGGFAILTDAIIRLDSTKTGRTLYKHPKFYIEPLDIRDEEAPQYRDHGFIASVYQEQESGKSVCLARFKSKKQAENWVKFMKGERYCK